MADEQNEPGELTERFRAFAETVDPEPSKALPTGMIVTGALLVLAIIAVIWVVVAL